MKKRVLKLNKLRQLRLKDLDLPSDLKKLNFAECEYLCKEIRKVLVDTVSANGGHLSSNLGTVELTLAIHRVFNSPDDKIVFDVGHQAYTHKLLTGRYDRFDTLRKKDGISGFCKPTESVHDPVVTGHSSTAVSSAYGVACAMKAMGSKNHAVAVVGDGAFTGGMAYEGLNNAGKSDANLIVILNINEMSISKNVGGMAKYLSALRYKDSYLKTKSIVERILNNTPLLGKPIKAGIKKSKDALKNAILDSTIFEQLGFEFIGPIDGHDQKELEEALRAAKSKNRPALIAAYTVKGKGYPPAEANPGGYHGVSSFELATGNPDVVPKDSFSVVFGKHLLELARNDDRICAVTAAMKYGTGLQYFSKEFPDRFFDVGIAEEHAVTFSAGLAVMGMIPVFAVYSTFLQRSYDQLIHDVSISNTHAVICVDRAGIVGDDGETHNGVFDVPFLTTIPNITIFSPTTYGELKLCLDEAIYKQTGLVVVRYPRGKDNSRIDSFNQQIDYSYTNSKSKTLVVSYGRLTNNVYTAVEKLKDKNIQCDVLRLVKIYPIADDLKDIISNYENVIFFEESEYQGSVSQKFQAMFPQVKSYAIYGFVKQATMQEAFVQLGFNVENIMRTIEENL